MVVIRGEEDTSSKAHLIGLGTESPGEVVVVQGIQGRIDSMIDAGGLAVIAHPSVPGFLPEAELKALSRYTGIEINSEQDLALWDALLTQRTAAGQPLLWGFMSNDSNNANEFEAGRVMARLPHLSKDDVIASLRQGSFCWGTDTVIADVSAAGGVINVRLYEKGDIMFIASGGRVAGNATGRSGEYKVQGDEGYIRVEVKTASGKRAGSQPLRIEVNKGVSNPYAVEGRWYKGNLHAHTTGSSGLYPEASIIELFRKNGYSFIAITDAVAWLLPAEV